MVKADAYYGSRDYVAAIKLYKKAIRKTDDLTQQQHIARQIAISYFRMREFVNAADWFEDAIGDHTNDVESYILYAQSLAAVGSFIEAKGILENAIKENPKNTELHKRIEAINIIIADNYDSEDIVTKMPVINSDYSDFSIGSWQDGIVFSSMRKNKGGQRTDGRTGQGFSDLYFSKYNDEQSTWNEPKPLSNKLNSLNNDGTFTYDEINNTAYWTTCTEKPNNCLIYSSSYSKVKNSWSKPAKVAFMSAGYNYGHPFINESGSTLYFTSNMSGGYGLNDIWKITRKNDGFWGVPVNLGGEVNSAENEMFPAIYGDTLLFYSSDGIDSYGGLDIYFSIKRAVEFTEPINSAADDFGLLINKNQKDGYFCSNRDLETSDDIYKFSGFPIKITMQGSIYNESGDDAIANAMIVYINSMDESDTVFSEADGSYNLVLDGYDNYRISVTKEMYFKEDKIISTSENELLFSTSPQLVVDFFLTRKSYPCIIKGLVSNKETDAPMSDITVTISSNDGFSTYVKTNLNGSYTFTGLKPNTIYTIKTGKTGYFSESRVCTLPKVLETMVFSKSNGYDMDFQLLKIQTKQEVTLNNIYYDYNKATLRPTSMIELDKLASMIRETPGILIQINAYTDERGRSEYNMKLSAKRANSVVEYLISKGVNRERLIAKGYGESKLLIVNAITEDDHQANRRTAFQVIDAKLVESTETVVADNTPDNEESTELEYRIQLFITGTKRNISSDFSQINKLYNVKVYETKAGTMWKYEAGYRLTFERAEVLKDKIRSIGFKVCFIVSYYNGAKIPVQQAVKIEKGENK